MSFAAPAIGWVRRAPRAVHPGLTSRFRRGARIAREVWTPVGERVARVNDWITPAGWVAVTGAGFGLAIGIPAGWTELRVIGLVSLLLVTIAVGWLLGRTSYDVTFDLPRSRVTAGETASGRLEVRNKARRSLFATRIELNVGRGRAHFTLPSLAHDEAYEQLFDVPTRRRGVITIGPIRSVRSDPLTLLRRVQQWADSIDLFVHPVTVPLTNDMTGFIRDIEGVTTQDLSSNDVSFHALREYQPGDDRRAIHWKTTARTGRLMVRQFEETRRAHLLVVLPTHLDDYRSEDDFESAISIAGSLARHAFSLERQVTIYTSSGEISGSAAPLMLDRLAALQPATKVTTLRDLASRAIGAVPSASVAMLIAGGDADPRDLRGAHKSIPLSVTCLGLRCDATLTLAQRRIGDLTLVDLPDVQALPRALRSIR
ncbi:DUF58 domain-containing protein [Nocardioides humilatus]|uniref:DUF58 domain-containing protein n=1 Tax=Nocardioides humilatus TaxID=2607660 RepID=A0A5B1LLA3_9ACTN|nr:DUF58 domain-containing protein [Nocardioides humilatus]KAA1421545.1 DUF58 domain-containing protein [Nocardioides humilatus]